MLIILKHFINVCSLRQRVLSEPPLGFEFILSFTESQKRGMFKLLAAKDALENKLLEG